jgi:uncharacterized protein (DUF58 family)
VLSEEILKQIRMLHFKSRKMAVSLFAGHYTSAFRGQGMEFSEVREYSPGDDPRSIDWNVSARLGHPYVKIFHEERELTVILAVDISGSHQFGTRQRLKKEVAAEVAGMLAFLATRTNDKVGLILFSTEVEKFIPPKKDASHVWRLIKEIFTYKPLGKGTSLNVALNFLNKAVKRHAIVFIISDFQDSNFEKALTLARRKHDLTAIRITDPMERELPACGLVSLRDPESAENIVLDTASPAIRQKIKSFMVQEETRLKEIFFRSGTDLVDLFTNQSVVKPMMRLFEIRERR